MMLAGLILFFGMHLVPSVPGVREGLVARMGENPYKGLFALVSIGGLVLFGFGFADRDYHELWTTPAWGPHLAMTVMPVVFVLWLAGEGKGRIRKKLKHPMVYGTFLWSLVHLVNNGDLGSVYLFGGFALYSLFAVYSANRRGKVPNYTEPRGRSDVISVVGGLALYGLVLWGHEFVLGVSPGI